MDIKVEQTFCLFMTESISPNLAAKYKEEIPVEQRGRHTCSCLVRLNLFFYFSGHPSAQTTPCGKFGSR